MGYFEQNRNVPVDGPWCDLVWFSEGKDHMQCSSTVAKIHETNLHRV